MRKIADVAILIGFSSLVISLVAKVLSMPVIIGHIVLWAHHFLKFSNTCFLIAITFILLEMLEGKK